MKIFRCPVIEVIPHPPSASTFLVSAKVVKQWRALPDFRSIIRQKAADFLKYTRVQSKKSQLLQAQKYDAAYQAEWERERTRLAAENEQQWQAQLNELIQWHVKASALESKVYCRVLARAVNWLESALESIAAQVDWSTLLEEQLKAYLEDKPPLSNHMTIWFSPDVQGKLTDAFSQYEGIRCLPKEEMGPGQARIETEFFTVTLDAAQQLEQIRKAIAEQWSAAEVETSDS